MSTPDKPDKPGQPLLQPPAGANTADATWPADAEATSVFLHSMRFHAPVSTEHDSIDDAVGSARWEREENTAAPVKITDADGNVLLEGRAFQEALERKGDEIEGAYGSGHPG